MVVPVDLSARAALLAGVGLRDLAEADRGGENVPRSSTAIADAATRPVGPSASVAAVLPWPTAMARRTQGAAADDAGGDGVAVSRGRADADAAHSDVPPVSSRQLSHGAVPHARAPTRGRAGPRNGETLSFAGECVGRERALSPESAKRWTRSPHPSRPPRGDTAANGRRGVPVCVRRRHRPTAATRRHTCGQTGSLTVMASPEGPWAPLTRRLRREVASGPPGRRQGPRGSEFDAPGQTPVGPAIFRGIGHPARLDPVVSLSTCASGTAYG